MLPVPTASSEAGKVQQGPPVERLTYTLPEAARATGLSVATLRRHEKAGRLRFHKVGGRTLVAAGSLQELLTGECA